MSADRKIAQAWLESNTRGIIELTHDWRGRTLPPIGLTPKGASFATLTKVHDYVFGAESGYFANRKGEIFFLLNLDQHPDLAGEGVSVYLAGEFNGWQDAVGRDEWRLRSSLLAGQAVLLWSGRTADFFSQPPKQFKFVTGEHRWLDVSGEAPNALRDSTGNVNRYVDPDRTGQHLFQFTLTAPLALSEAWSVTWPGGETVALRPGNFFFELGSEKPLGAMVRGGETVFRLFAPRAKEVTLCLSTTREDPEAAHRYPLVRHSDGVWEIAFTENLAGWFYWYSVDGPRGMYGYFDPAQRILDPYALAAVDRVGPGIVIDRDKLGKPDRSFRTAPWQDLVIAEAHVRDLTEKAPVKMRPEERRGFVGLRKWVESADFYLHLLGVNAVELQPVQEFDNRTPQEYHWGYMTNNFFALESSYSLEPAVGSAIREFRALVEAFHRRGIAVILDVVYNHVGEPAHLMAIDKLYYFEMDTAGQLSNWSGCGNDLRARSRMSRRLIVDSLRYLIEMFGVDGFRLDLAELIGLDVLKEIEVELKRTKADVILIAEPWSFRGHLAGELRNTGWASWNDGYRNFLREFVRGGGTREGYEYYLKGSPWYFAKWPAQTVNYVESHDDRTWIDLITENAGNDGTHPTSNDRQRTHLMAAILFSSIGIPMIAAGQDFLRSKQGVNNTYQRGDLNALDYRRIYRYPATHTYFADWIAFRRSPAGRLLRLFSRPTEGFFQFYFAPNSTAAATIYNADRSHGSDRVLFAVNPTLADAAIAVGEEVAEGNWRQVADHERFLHGLPEGIREPVEPELFLPPLSCGLWVSEG